MKEFKGTKGEWKICKSDTLKGLEPENYVVIFSDKRVKGKDELYPYESVCIISSVNNLNKGDEANAKLIASAPELLEALQSLIEKVEWSDWNAKELEKAEQAINKALN